MSQLVLLIVGWLGVLGEWVRANFIFFLAMLAIPGGIVGIALKFFRDKKKRRKAP